MKICYIDEAGGFEPFVAGTGSTPLMVIAGVVLDHNRLPQLTKDYLGLKGRYFPRLVQGHLALDRVLDEVKGADVRAQLRSTSRDRRRHGLRFLRDVVDLLARVDAQILGRVWIKAPGKSLNPTGSYTFAIQDIAEHFNHLLATTNSLGLMLLDGREYKQDAQVSHSLFTQKHKAGGDALPQLIEVAAFGRSVNHVGLQLADLVASTMIFPMAARTYCVGHCTGPHMSVHYDSVRQSLGPVLKPLRYAYRDAAGRRRGGLVVSDKLGNSPSSLLFA